MRSPPGNRSRARGRARRRARRAPRRPTPARTRRPRPGPPCWGPCAARARCGADRAGPRPPRRAARRRRRSPGRRGCTGSRPRRRGAARRRTGRGGSRVALLRARDDVAQREVAAALGEHGQQHARADVHLEAPAVAAAAHGAVLVDRHVPDLARDARAAVHDAPAQDEPAAHAVGHAQVGDGVVPDGRPEPGLGEGAEVGVVVDRHGRAELGLEQLGTTTPSQPRIMPTVAMRPARTSTGAGTPTPTASSSSGTRRPTRPSPRRAARRAAGRCPRGGPGRAACAGRRARAWTRPRARRASSGCRSAPRDEPEVAREGDLEGAAPAARGRRGVQDARAGELLDDVGDGGRGQPGDAGQLDLREGATLLDGAHDPGSVGLTQ